MSIISLVAQCQSSVLLSTSAPKMTRSLRTVPCLWAGEPIADAAHRRGPTRAKSLVLKKRFMGCPGEGASLPNKFKKNKCHMRTRAIPSHSPRLPREEGASIKLGTSIGPRPRTEQKSNWSRRQQERWSVALPNVRAQIPRHSPLLFPRVLLAGSSSPSPTQIYFRRADTSGSSPKCLASTAKQRDLKD